MTTNWCRRWFFVFWLSAFAARAALDPAPARDRQDTAALDKLTADAAAAAEKSPQDAGAHYQAALTASYAAEVALELRDKPKAQRTAEAGIKAADRAIALKPGIAEYYRVLGTLCGQAIAGGNVITGLSHGKRAKEAITKALELDARAAPNWLARAVGNYYLPPALGGGADAAIADIKKALELDPKSADAYLWLGLSLRKAHRNAEARQAFQKSVELNPRRIWAKQQLEKTPAQ
jgi:tetratricopeptide (TPR) repeat protein